MTLEVGFMVATAKKMGEGRYRESFGRAYEDFTVGDIYEHRPGRTITETDNTWFTLLTMNKHPLHFDQEYARHSEFGRCIVASPFTVAFEETPPAPPRPGVGAPLRVRPLHRCLAVHCGVAGRHERQRREPES